MKTKTRRDELAHPQPSVLVALRQNSLTSPGGSGEAPCVRGVRAGWGNGHHMLIKSHTQRWTRCLLSLHLVPRELLWRNIQETCNRDPSKEWGEGGKDERCSLYIFPVFF